MSTSSTTLQLGDSAPDFTLPAANRFDSAGNPRQVSLRRLTAKGPLIVEFLRGTW